jgi:hypothetical protein
MNRSKIIVIMLVGLISSAIAFLSVDFNKQSDFVPQNIKNDSLSLNPDSTFVPIKRKVKIKDLSLQELWSYYQINPCYLPLLKDPDQWEKGTRVGFDYENLFNDSLPKNHKYRNRYLVGDFNVLDINLKNKGAKEIYPVLIEMKDFDGLSTNLVNRMDTTRYGTPNYYRLLEDIRSKKKDSAEVYINFLEKVWKYRMVPIAREFSIEGNNLYATGQSIILCEACEDTIIMLGRFAISSKRQDPCEKVDENGKIHRSYFEYLPYGKRRKYYAGKNRITSKNWETERKYEKFDIERDKSVGGGNNRVTYFRGNVQLPNFLLIKPSEEYVKSMHGNGIHEVALSGLSRGMLGTANSIGCIRVSDFGSKFIRWWVPQNCNFFISFDDKRYHKKILSGSDSILPFLPFKTKAQGDQFRKWINKNYYFEAKQLDLKEEGDYRNGFIIDAYFYLKKEYDSYLNNLKK